jgi:1,4-alpha-glucan branching enzyme
MWATCDATAKPHGECFNGENSVIKMTKPGRDDVVRVTFVLPADQPAGAVSVVGDFNDWDPFAHPLRRRANGTRTAVVKVPAGSKVLFRYLAEGGLWFDDETADQIDERGALIAV